MGENAAGGGGGAGRTEPPREAGAAAEPRAWGAQEAAAFVLEHLAGPSGRRGALGVSLGEGGWERFTAQFCAARPGPRRLGSIWGGAADAVPEAADKGLSEAPGEPSREAAHVLASLAKALATQVRPRRAPRPQRAAPR